MIRLAICLLAVALLGACAGEQAHRRPPLAQRVFDQGKEGQAAYLKGDLRRAQRLFELAWRDALQIEDSAGVAVMALSLARVARESGASAAGLARLESVSDWHRTSIPARLQQEIELLTAVLLADLGRTDAALLQIAALREKCPNICELSVGADGLQARLTLEKGDARRALDLAETALAAFRTHENQQEVANLFRVQGEADLALGDFSGARRALEEALNIDKTLALPAKIALDLSSLARVALAAQDTEARARYQGRLDELRMRLK